MTSAAPCGRRPLLLMMAGFVLIQVAWVFAVPPYGGTDEFDHAYRAAAVARGEWVAPAVDATRGTGAFLKVPDDIVAAAGPQCRALEYTTAADCESSGDRGDGLVAVASGAGRYHPAFYAAVGSVALPFEGHAALYAMRAATAALSALLLAAGVWSLLRWSSGPWPLLGLVVGLTPVLLFSTSVVAPNGVEMTAAVAAWTGTWGLVNDDFAHRGHLLSAVLGACVLVTTRSLGPLWLGLLLLAVLAASGGAVFVRGRIAQLARDSWVMVAGLVVVGVTLASCAWILSMRSLAVGGGGVAADTGWGDGLYHAGVSLPLWVLQSVAAFPHRDQPAPVVVYVAALTLLVGLAAMAARRGRRRVLVIAATVAVVGLVIPFAITLATYADFGLAYQGRYTLPLTIGLPLLLGVAIDGRVRLSQPLRLLVPVAALLAIAHAVSVGGVLSKQRVVSPLTGSPHWPLPPTWSVSVLAALGTVLLCWAVWCRMSTQTSAASP